jgi:hypothetical protein
MYAKTIFAILFYFTGIQTSFFLACTSTDLIRQKEPVFQVTPNPGSGIYTVVYKGDLKGSVTLAVSDGTGKYVYLKSIRDFSGELKETIDLSGNPKGLYIFEIEGDNARELKKVVFQ